MNGHAQREYSAAFSPVLEILSPAADKIGGGERELLCGEGLDSRALKADELNRPRQISRPDGVAALFRLLDAASTKGILRIGKSDFLS